MAAPLLPECPELLRVATLALSFLPPPVGFSLLFAAPCCPHPWWRGGWRTAPLDWWVWCLIFSGSRRQHDPPTWLVPDWKRPWTSPWSCCYAYASIPPLEGGLLLFTQVWLRLDEMWLEFSPGLFRIQIGAPGSAVLSKLACLHNKAICNAHDLSFHDGIDRRGCIVYALVEPCI